MNPPPDIKSDLGIGASRGAFINGKGNLRANLRFQSDDSTSGAFEDSKIISSNNYDGNGGDTSPSKMPPLHPYKRQVVSLRSSITQKILELVWPIHDFEWRLNTLILWRRWEQLKQASPQDSVSWVSKSCKRSVSIARSEEIRSTITARVSDSTARQVSLEIYNR